jgi:hypothetical protein
MTTDLKPEEIPVIFAASPVNGARYIGDYLPVRPVEWPRGTWFQQRLEQLRKGEQGDETSRST